MDGRGSLEDPRNYNIQIIEYNFCDPLFLSTLDTLDSTSQTQTAEETPDLFRHSDHRKAIEQAARRTVEQSFNWDAIAAAQSRLYRELTGGSGR